MNEQLEGFLQSGATPSAPASEPATAAASSNAGGQFLTSPDGRLIIVGVEHGKAPTLPSGMQQSIRDISKAAGAYYEGNGDDRAPVSEAMGGIEYKGSWDDLMAPPTNRSDFLYTMFSNPEPQTARMVSSLAGRGSIRDALVQNPEIIAHPSISRDMKPEDVDTFLQQAQMADAANRPSTPDNLTQFLRSGAEAMWPDNWQSFPNPAGKIAERASMHRLRGITDRGEGVFFVGSDNIPLLQRLAPQLTSPRSPQQ